MRNFNVTKEYNRNEFKNFLQDFLSDDYTSTEEQVFFNSANIEKACKLGESEELDLTVYEFVIKSSHDPRVTVTKEVCTFMKRYSCKSNVLASFYSEKNPQWRLSLITTDFKYENGKVKSLYSNPRRYSFLLGPECKAHTPETMFAKQVSDTDDLKKRFSVDVVTKEFYKDLFNWYEWASTLVEFPQGDTTKDKNGNFNIKLSKDNNSLNLIRLITRLMFVWFIKQKDLIPSWIFDTDELKNILAEFEPESAKNGNYYNAVIQNLFFATLNRKIEDRAFADDTSERFNKQFGVKNYYRDNRKKTFFKETNEQIIERFKPVPFLNGGLFECLDVLVDDETQTKNIEVFTDGDGFSREPDWMAFIPNHLFWQEDDGEHEGLIHILNRYNFTVEENTPSDVQVALDPELLGKVFENLLGTYNPETSETARKDSGSFYTPREIVDFMVDESLKAYLLQNVQGFTDKQAEMLFNDAVDLYTENNNKEIVNAIKTVKILDPACGSGAFPMGMLHKMIQIVKKCDGVKDDEKSIYQLKLALIENCLYGLDIQPIAVQICKLRFFISLICEQEKNNNIATNYGFDPLPNLETKFIAANTLIGKKQSEQSALFEDPEINKIKKELKEVRHAHFNAATAKAKAECRERDKKLRNSLADLLAKDRIYKQEEANQLAAWNPYDQNAVSGFFDSEWMFDIKDGFDIVIGNPPYIQLAKGKLTKIYELQNFAVFARTGDIYCLFYEKGYGLLKPNACLCYITSNKWMRAGYGEKLRLFLSNKTDPKLLIDFGEIKIFESATVDTNILLFKKEENKKQTIACIIKNYYRNSGLKLSDFIQQKGIITGFTNKESWVILSPIEQSIKRKIEAVGVPLKDWDISINYGIKTGFNDAFIINGAKRDEILSACKTENERNKTAELIRPILRGRDIKRYEYNFADLYLINTHNGVKEKNIPRIAIEDYPTVKAHLDEYWEKIEKRADQGDTPYNLRNCAYMDEFNKPKIVWGNLNLSATYAFAPAGMMINAPATMIVPYSKYLLYILNSKLADYYIRKLGVTRNGGYFEYKPMFVEQMPVPYPIDDTLFAKFDDNYLYKYIDEINNIVYTLYNLDKQEMKYIEDQTI